jgi:hypothetical protein
MNPKYRVVSIIARGAILACGWAAAVALAAAGAPPATGPASQVPRTATAAAAPTATAAGAPAAGVTTPAAGATTPAGGATAPAGGATATPNTVPATGAPAVDTPPADFKTLDQEVQGLKKDVIDLNKDLFVLEEELLFPANTQVALYVSMDVGTFFALDSVTVKIDNKEVKNYLYTAREADALLKGGVQQIYLGNLKVGKHELVAFFTGKGPAERDYKRGATINFDKGVGAKYLELKITDRVAKHQPEFTIKDWE